MRDLKISTLELAISFHEVYKCRNFIEQMLRDQPIAAFWKNEKQQAVSSKLDCDKITYSQCPAIYSLL